jgi:hypothetical protein
MDVPHRRSLILACLRFWVNPAASQAARSLQFGFDAFLMF